MAARPRSGPPSFAPSTRSTGLLPDIPMAGRAPDAEVDSAAICLQPTLAPEAGVRPPTPTGPTSRFRQSYKQQVGLRFIHTGLVGQPLPPPHVRFGVRTDTGDRAGDALDTTPDSELGSFLVDHKESIYRSHKREPLGESYKRGHTLPGFTADDEFKFGKRSAASESAKNLIYVAESPHTHIARDIPEREVTRQLVRGYDWTSPGVDPRTHRFGKVDKDALTDGVAKSLRMIKPDTKIGSARVEQVKAAQSDPLGRQKNPKGAVRDLPAGFTFGSRAAPIDEWGARRCIRGDYRPEEKAPDRDLGTSTRTLKRLEQVPRDPARVYGTPSVRTDRALPPTKSIANAQNWGDEHDGKGLLYPSTYAYHGVDEDDFRVERKSDQIRKLFLAMGETFEDSQFARLCDVAVRDFGVLSVDSFRHAANKSRFEILCETCSRPRCQHDFCSRLACRHDASANHAAHAAHELQTFPNFA